MRLVNPLSRIRTRTRLMCGADAEAARTGQPAAGAEHVLLSALALPDGSARRVLQRVGANPDALRREVAARHGELLRAIARAQTSADGALRSAMKLAKSEPGGQLTGAHVVVAVAELEDGLTATALRALGVDPAQLARAARAELDAGDRGAARTSRP